MLKENCRRRRMRFIRLMEAAYAQTTDWLVKVLKDPGPHHMSQLSRLACLRVVVARHPTDLPYIQRKRLVKAELGI